MDNINIPRKRGRPLGSKKKIINNEPETISEQQQEQETIEEHWAKKSASRNATWDEDSVSTIQDNDFLAELDNEHYKEDPINVDDLFKNSRPQRTKVKREKKSQFEDENSLFSERGPKILGQERRVLLSKIQQYKNLFPDELKKFKIKKNCSTHDLQLYLQEMEVIVNTDSVEQFLTDSIIQCIKLTEGISSYTKYDISGCADMLKGNKQFHTLCKQLYIKYKVFSNIPPEYSIVILVATTAYICKTKNTRKKDLEVFLNAKIEKSE
jgi:hypothetical protein